MSRSFEEEEQDFLRVFAEMIDGYNENIRRYNENIRRYDENITQSIQLLMTYSNDVIDGYNENIRRYHENIRRYNENISQSIQLLITTRERNIPERFSPRNVDFSEEFPFLFAFPLNDVEIPNNFPILTPLQISNATSNLVFVSSPNVENEVCPISLEEFIDGEELIKIKGCGHMFKKASLYRWFLRSTVCPSCRYDILNITINETPLISPDTEQLLRQLYRIFHGRSDSNN